MVILGQVGLVSTKLISMTHDSLVNQIFQPCAREWQSSWWFFVEFSFYKIHDKKEIKKLTFMAPDFKSDDARSSHL
jgi:hypothetical protein